MSNPKRPTRPKKRPQRADLSADERKNLAARASYVGSAEHKVKSWWGGLPEAKQLPDGKVIRPKKPRKQTTTLCPLTSLEDRNRATQWVRSAIASGQYRFYEGDQDFPKKVWHCADGRIWCGLCVNPSQGEYKGWPVEEQERHAIFD